MTRRAPAMTVRQNLGELLNEVQYRGDTVLITKAGKPVAALVDVALYDNIRRMRGDFDRLCAELAESAARIPPRELEALVDESVRAARARGRSHRPQRALRRPTKQRAR